MVKYNLRIDAELLKKIKQQAKREYLPISVYIRQILAKDVEKKEKEFFDKNK